ncbi:MAG: DUF6447 family protein [Halothiobacillaceae bacterium]|nr:DUF6447 family protein [Halothiobacillaceae bacterium]
MATLTVEGKEYDMDLLSAEAKAQVTSLQFVDAEIARLNAQIAICQTAKIGYLNALKPHLEALAGAGKKKKH